MHWNKGFTLIELMLVIAIAGILFAVASGSYQEYAEEKAAEQEQVRIERIMQERAAQAVSCIDGYLFTTTGSPVYGDDGFAKSCD